jgi:voltage-gated potassium channel
MHKRVKKLIKHIFIAMTIFFLVVLVGSAIIGSIENWDYLNSFYFMTMVSTTVGFGDVVPISNAGKMFVSFYSLLSIGSFLYIFALIAVQSVEIHN